MLSFCFPLSWIWFPGMKITVISISVYLLAAQEEEKPGNMCLLR